MPEESKELRELRELKEVQKRREELEKELKEAEKAAGLGVEGEKAPEEIRGKERPLEEIAEEQEKRQQAREKIREAGEIEYTNLEQALQLYEEAFELDPEEVPTGSVAILYKDIGNLNKAIEYQERYIDWFKRSLPSKKSDLKREEILLKEWQKELTEKGKLEGEIAEEEISKKEEASEERPPEEVVKGKLEEAPEEIRKEEEERAIREAEEAEFKERALTPEEKLVKAREIFVEKEKGFEESKRLYGRFKELMGKFGISKWKEEKANIVEEYEHKKQEYEQARAEYVAEDIEKFVLEQTNLADQRAEQRKVSELYKWWKGLGERNLESFYKKRTGKEIKSKWLRFGARMVSVRTGFSMCLLGGGILAGAGTATGIGIFLARRAMATAGTSVGTYDLLKMGTEKWAKTKGMRAEMSDEEISKLSNPELEERLAHFRVKSALQGEKVSENKTYQKLQQRYIEQVKNEVQEAESRELRVDTVLKEIMVFNDKRFEEAKTRAKWDERRIKVVSVLVGAFVGSGVWSEAIREKWEEVGEIKEKLPGVVEAVKEKGKVGLEWIKEQIRPEKTIPTEVPPVTIPEEIPELGLLPEEEIYSPLPPKEVYGPPRPPVEAAEIPKVPAPKVTEVTTVEITREIEMPEKFVETVQKGEGYLHEARKAITEYMDKKGIDLTEAQRIKAESDLLEEFAKDKGVEIGKLEMLHPGNTVEFETDDIKNVVENVQERFGTPQASEQLTENLKDYTEKVDWERYEVEQGKGTWLKPEYAEGVKVPETPVPPEEIERLVEETKKTIEEMPLREPEVPEVSEEEIVPKVGEEAKEAVGVSAPEEVEISKPEAIPPVEKVKPPVEAPSEEIPISPAEELEAMWQENFGVMQHEASEILGNEENLSTMAESLNIESDVLKSALSEIQTSNFEKLNTLNLNQLKGYDAITSYFEQRLPTDSTAREKLKVLGEYIGRLIKEKSK